MRVALINEPRYNIQCTEREKALLLLAVGKVNYDAAALHNYTQSEVLALYNALNGQALPPEKPSPC